MLSRHIQRAPRAATSAAISVGAASSIGRMRLAAVAAAAAGSTGGRVVTSTSASSPSPLAPFARAMSTQPPPQMKKEDITDETIGRNKVIAAALLAAAAVVWYASSGSIEKAYGAKKPDEFTITYHRGGGYTWTFPYKPMAEVERILHEHEETTTPGRSGNPVLRWDTNYIESNEPCEDRNAVDIVPRGPAPAHSWWNFWSSSPTAPVAGKDAAAEGSRDLVLVSVIDGHAGDATSRLLKRTLHPTVALALAGLQAGIVPNASWYSRLADTLTWSKTWSPSNIAKTIQSAFVQLDDHICYTPIRMLPEFLTVSEKDMPDMREKFVALTEPAASGAVAASMLVDAENKGIYVAVTGDCRAVAGWQRPDGSWRCDTLSEDQMGDNPVEVRRMRSEHPIQEADTVIRNGRVQGGLQPTRAFGDAVYKWTTLQGEAISALFKDDGVKARPIRPWNFTPPYVTARPEVTYRSLESEEKLRFVILATDGLWDRITSEEAALLMAGYLEHPKHDPVAKTDLPNQINLVTTAPRPYPVEDMPGQGKRAKGAWAFDGDVNAATHLSRNALGGANRKKFQELMSLYGKTTRYFRDDMTVTVVLFDDDGNKQ